MSTSERVAAVEGAEPAADDRASMISRLFREHNRTLVGFLRARLHDEQEAREIAQEAYVRLLQLEQPGVSSFLRAYLFRIAANLAVDRIRQRRSRSRLDQLDAIDEFLDEATAERVTIAGQELTQLKQAVDELPAKCQQAFRLHKLEDRSLAEVAVEMGLTERMVRKYIARALVYIRLRREGVPAEQAHAQVMP